VTLITEEKDGCPVCKKRLLKADCVAQMLDKTWKYISQLKQLSSDNSQHMWTFNNNGLNSFLSNLPWQALDRPVNCDALVYNVDSKGALHLLGIMYIVRIRTCATHRTIIYKYDQKHAKLHTFRVCNAMCSNVGIKRIARNSFKI